MTITMPTFWKWFLFGHEAGAGWRRIVDGWVVGHVIIGFCLFVTIPMPTMKASGVVLIPLASIFIGLTFAWIANVQSILASSEIEKFVEYRSGGFPEYVFPFQLGVLTVLICLLAWGLAGVGVMGFAFGKCSALLKGDGGGNAFTWSKVAWESIFGECRGFSISEVALYSLISFSVRECWRLISGTMLLLISRHVIAKHENSRNQDKEQ